MRRLKQIVEPALSAGALAIASAQIPFNIRDGRIRVGATTLDANGVRAIVSGGYDIPADQADIRAALALTMAGRRPAVPEIQLFAVGHARCAHAHRRRRRRCRPGWRCGRSITKPEGSTRSSAANRRRRCRRRYRCRRWMRRRRWRRRRQRAVTQVPVPGRDPRRPPAKPKAARRARRAPPVANAPPAPIRRRRAEPAAGRAAAAADRREARARRAVEAEAAAAARADAAGRQSAARRRCRTAISSANGYRFRATISRSISDRLQECLIVADHDQRAVESAQRVFQFLDRREIEMVGRLVQQQQEWRLRSCEHAGHSRAQALAAARACRRSAAPRGCGRQIAPAPHGPRCRSVPD